MNKRIVLYLSYAAKIGGFLAGLGAIPFIEPETGVLVVLGGSLLKDTANRLSDILDNGREDGSFTVV